MEMILAILLWLGCISAPNTYYQVQIDAYSTQHQQVIGSVMENPPQQEYIWQQYGAATESVLVIDPFR